MLRWWCSQSRGIRNFFRETFNKSSEAQVLVSFGIKTAISLPTIMWFRMLTESRSPSNGNTYPAKVVGEPRKDIAVLKVESFNMEQTPFGQKVADSSRILVGQKAIAGGNPFGLDNTLTVVTALGRSFPSVGGVTIRDMIQTDASINYGILVDHLSILEELIGINTAIYSKWIFRRDRLCRSIQYCSTNC